MPTFFERLEKVVDKSIPFLMIVLAAMILLGFFIDLENYEPYTSIIDGTILAFFIIDLYFKWTHIRNLKKFVKLFWLDIIAVFPFYLVFRTYLFAAEISAATREAQAAFHEVVLIREAEFFNKALKESSIVAREERAVVGGIRLLQRTLRFVSGRLRTSHYPMFEKHMQLQEKGQYSSHHKKNKSNIKKIKK
jgi:hypothetical protein